MNTPYQDWLDKKARKNMCNITVEPRYNAGRFELMINRGSYISSAMVNNEDLDDLIQALTTYRDALPKPCVHAELIKQYAEDCQKVERPWELWEVRVGSDNYWHIFTNHPNWLPQYQYRRKSGAAS